MAVVKEFYKTREDGIKLYKSYSNNGVKIKKVGTVEVYDEAIDIEGAPFVYTETDEPIEVEQQETE